MNAMQAKAALLSEAPVLHKSHYGEIVYNKITALILRKDKSGTAQLSAEMLDKNKNSVVIASIERIHEAQPRLEG